MKRRVSLRPHEADIRRWVDEGKDDGWIASALGASPSSIQSFRSRRRIHRKTREGRHEPLPGPRDFRAYEGVLEEMAEGGGQRRTRWAVWFDPAIQDDPAYASRWRRARKVGVRLTERKIFLISDPGER
ncbi:MAG: hypothetical protein AB1425_02765 [Actinomycetota bacterium]